MGETPSSMRSWRIEIPGTREEEMRSMARAVSQGCGRRAIPYVAEVIATAPTAPFLRVRPFGLNEADGEEILWTLAGDASSERVAHRIVLRVEERLRASGVPLVSLPQEPDWCVAL